jgi:predicted acyltransferase
VNETAPAPAVTPAKPPRVVSVDALRGFDMFWILGGDSLAAALQEMSKGKEGALAAFGNFAGNQLEHVEWAGFRFYDMIFPLFVFIVGVSLVFSLTRLVEQEGKAAAHRRVLRRFVLLFVLALIYSGGMSKLWPDIRLLGVLNRIALCYLFASLLFLNLRWRGLVAACVTLLVGYWALMMFVPVPGFGAGVIEPGQNLSNWIDANYLPGKRWDGTWDPEGLLSTLPAIATCLLGVLSGLWLRRPCDCPRHKSLWLVSAGVIMVLLGYIWGFQFPVVKKIWTSSFVLVAGGYSVLLLGVFHQVIDVWGKQKWAVPFIWIGANAIVLYFADSIVGFEKLAHRLVGGNVAKFFNELLTPGTGHLLAAGVGLLLAVALAGFLYRRKIFLRV